MSVISMKQLLEAGVHFGHQTRRWNPKMAEYIFTERNGIYIINLEKTVKKANEAYEFVKNVAAEGGDILFVRNEEAGSGGYKGRGIKMRHVLCKLPDGYGGMLTNFKTIQTRIARLFQLKKMEEDGTFGVLPKKEVIKLRLRWSPSLKKILAVSRI